MEGLIDASSEGICLPRLPEGRCAVTLFSLLSCEESVWEFAVAEIRQEQERLSVNFQRGKAQLELEDEKTFERAAMQVSSGPGDCR